MASLLNIKNEKTLKQFFFTTTPWLPPPLPSFPTTTTATADDTTALPPCHHGALMLPCCCCCLHTATATNPALLPSFCCCCHRQAARHAAPLLLSCRRHRGCLCFHCCCHHCCYCPFLSALPPPFLLIVDCYLYHCHRRCPCHHHDGTQQRWRWRCCHCRRCCQAAIALPTTMKLQPLPPCCCHTVTNATALPLCWGVRIQNRKKSEL
jgi:hypothetical protein